MIRPPPSATLFPYTTLFRSALADAVGDQLVRGRRAADRERLPAALVPARGRLRVRRAALARHLASGGDRADRKSTRLNSSHANISYAVFCLKKKRIEINTRL